MSVRNAIRAGFRRGAAALGCAVALAALWMAAEAIGAAATGWQASRISTAGSYEELRGLGQTPLAGATGAQHAHVAIGGNGEAVAVWEPVGTGTLVQSATYRPGVGWSAERGIPGAEGIGARVAMDAAGDAVVLWRHALDPDTVGLFSSVRRPGEPWAGPVLLSALGATAAEPEVAISPSGEAIAVWRSGTLDRSVIEVARSAPAGRWSRFTTVSPPGANFEPRVAVNGSGEALVAWEVAAGKETFVESSSRSRDGEWSPPIRIAPAPAAGGLNKLNLGLDDAGTAVAVWARLGDGGTDVVSSSRPAGGSWSALTTISTDPGGAVEPRFALNAAGQGLAVWCRDLVTCGSLEAASLTPAGMWSQPTEIGRAGGREIRLAIDREDEALVVWERPRTGEARLLVSSARSPAENWSPPQVLTHSRTFFRPDLAIGPHGEAVATWENWKDRAKRGEVFLSTSIHAAVRPAR